MRRKAGTIALVGLLILAGCTGFGGSPEGPPSTTLSTTAPSTESIDTATPETTATITINSSQVIEFQSLNASERAVFHDARAGKVHFLPKPGVLNGSVDSKHYETFDTHEYVRYEGDLYRIEQSGTMMASYTVNSNPVSDDELRNATVRPLSNVSASFRDEVRAAITNGSYHAPIGEWGSMPEPFDHYVRYENRTYSFSASVGDAWVPSITAVKAANTSA